MKIKFYNFIFFFILIATSAKSNEIDYNVIQNYDRIFNEKLLTASDVEKYQSIFILQKKCEFKKANKEIIKIKNDILMGHVLAQRYLHPNCYRSKFIELSSWLKMYNDHPQAKRIYRLAIRRMPEGYKRPPGPIGAIGIKQIENKLEKKSKKYESEIKLNKSKRKEKYQLLINIKSRVNSGWPTGAVKLLNQKKVKNLLDKVEIDQQKELIAKGYFLANKNELAIKYASEALKRSPEHVPFANWTAGLSAWRLNNYELAASFFTAFTVALKNDPWHQSSGSFWAARSYEQLNNYNKINFWLKIAAQNQTTFYGQLASNIMGVDNNIDWNINKLDQSAENIFMKYPAGKRIMATIQVGRINEAEKELIKLNNHIDESLAFASLKIANNFNFAYTQLKIASKLKSLGKSVPIKYLYPSPGWIPKKGYIVDKALIFAFIHQESNFNTNAKSRKGAVGLMQLMPSTAKFISKNKKISKNNSNILKEPLLNIELGQDYIDYLLKLKIVDNNLVYMAAAYNAGPGNLKKWLNEINHNNDSLLFMESIPSRETRWFMEKILTNYWLYKNQFNEDVISLNELTKGKEPIYLLN